MSANRNDSGGSGGLEFEPEAGPQSEALAELASGPPAPKSRLAFEPDEGDVLDRVRDSRLPSEGPPEGTGGPRSAGPRAEPEDEDSDIGSLVDLAAGQGRTFTPAPRRADLSGDLEAELFGPGSGPGSASRRGPRRGPTTARGKEAARQAESAAPPSSRKDDGPGDFGELGSAARGELTTGSRAASSGRSSGKAKGASGKSRGWLSVLVSDAVVGRRRKETTTRLLRSTRFAERAIGRTALGVAGALGRTDSFLRRARLSLASLVASAVIAAVALLIGVPLAWTGGIVAICLLLTVAGQPARNLLGYAGVIIAAAAAAEIVRQRDRFLEILKMFM